MEEKDPVIKVGGSLEQAKKGEYNLNVSAILNEAWQSTLKSRTAIMLGFIICLAIGLTITLIFSSQMGDIETVMQDPQSMTLLNILVTLIVAPFFAGVEMMGVFHSVGLKTKPQLVFAFMKRGSWLAVCALLTSTLTTIGFALLYVPGIFLAVALSLTLPLVIDKRLSPMKAIIVSVQALRFQWFKVFSIYLAVFLACILALVPFAASLNTGFEVIGIAVLIFASSYIVPFFYNVKGILYREIFGLQLQTSSDNTNTISSTFSA